jgi:uncharacterized protein with NRDE domain
MCLILFAWEVHPEYSLVVAANRDEYFFRPAAAAKFWDDQPAVLAGRDLQQGGTWLGINVTGGFAALTNYRNPFERRSDAVSRGELVRNFLTGTSPVAAYANELPVQAANYNGYSLLASDRSEMWYYSNRGGPPQSVAPGVHGLSNHLLDTPWLKVTAGQAKLRDLLTGQIKSEDLLELLDDRTISPDDALPDTGVGIERERQLSAARIVMPGYGTRCSTALLVGRDGAVEFVERSYREDGSVEKTVAHRFRLDREPAIAAS